MITSLMIFQAIISALLILTVLLQFGKGAQAGIFSGGASESVLSGAQKGNILIKITIVLSVIFLGNSILLAKLQSNASTRSILDSEAPIARPLNNDALNNDALSNEAVGTPAAAVDATPTPVNTPITE